MHPDAVYGREYVRSAEMRDQLRMAKLARDCYEDERDELEAKIDAIGKLHRPLTYTNRRQCCSTCNDADGRPMVWPCATATALEAK